MAQTEIEGPCEKSSNNKKFRSRWLVLKGPILHLFAKQADTRKEGAEKEQLNLQMLSVLRRTEVSLKDNKATYTVGIENERVQLRIDLQFADGWLAIFATYYTVATLDPGWFPIPINVAEGIWACVQQLTAKGYDEDGVFRSPGDTHKCNELQHQLLFEGSMHVAWGLYSARDIATVCKRMLGYVPNQLFQNFDAWMASTENYDPNAPEPNIKKLQIVLKRTHEMEVQLIRGLFALIKKVTQNDAQTHVGLVAMQKVLPVVLTPEEYNSDPLKIMEVTKKMEPLLEMLIKHHHEVFDQPHIPFGIPIPPLLQEIACSPFFKKYAGKGGNIYECVSVDPEDQRRKYRDVMERLDDEFQHTAKELAIKAEELKHLQREHDNQAKTLFRLEQNQEDLQEKLKKTKTKLSKTALTLNENTIAHDKQIGDMRTIEKDLKKKVKKLQEEKDEASKRLEQNEVKLSAETKKFEKERKRFKKKQNEIETQRNDLETEREKLRNKVEKQQKQVDMLFAKLEEERKTFQDNANKEAEKLIETIKAKHAAQNKKEIETIKAKHAAQHKKEVDAIKSKSDKQRKKLEAEVKKVKADLEKEKAKKVKTATAKKSPSADDDEKEHSDSLESKLEEYSKKIEELKSENQDLKDAKSQTEKDLFEFHGSEFAEENARLKQDNKTLLDEKEILQEKLRRLQKKLAEKRTDDDSSIDSSVKLKDEAKILAGKVIDRLVIREEMGKTSSKVALLLKDEHVVFSTICNSRVFIEYPMEGWASLRDQKGYPLIQKVRRESQCPREVQEFIQKRRKMGTRKKISIKNIES